MLVDASTGEVYTKMIGSAFFVGQVILQSFMTKTRGGMAVQKVPKSQVIKRLAGRNRTKSRDSKQVLDRHCYIG